MKFDNLKCWQKISFDSVCRVVVVSLVVSQSCLVYMQTKLNGARRRSYSVNFVDKNYDEKYQSTTLFSWRRWDIDKLKKTSLMIKTDEMEVWILLTRGYENVHDQATEWRGCWAADRERWIVWMTETATLLIDCFTVAKRPVLQYCGERHS